LFHQAMRLFVIEFLRDQAQSFGYAKNMNVHGKNLPLTREKQYAGKGTQLSRSPSPTGKHPNAFNRDTGPKI
jgi:hypothetical protein